MEKFNIRVLKKNPEKIKGKLYQLARITIGDFTERFWIPIDYWSLDRYKKQWKEGIERLRTYDSSCLVAKITIHEKELCICAWVLYKVGNSIIFQYHFYPDEEKIDQLPSFDFKTCYLHIRPWQTVKDKFEQWKMSIDDFFASQMQASKKRKSNYR